MEELRAPEWELTDEFAARLGCGLVTALLLPLWFAFLFFAVGWTLSDLGLWLIVGLFAVSAIGAVVAWRKIRSVPRRIALDHAELVVERPAGRRAIPLADIQRVEVGGAGALRPVTLTLTDGERFRMSRDLDDFEGFLAALEQAHPDVTVVSV